MSCVKKVIIHMEHVLAKEAVDGKPEAGVMETAVSYVLYQT